MTALSRMRSPLRKLGMLVTGIGLLSVAAAQEPWQFEDVQRFVAVSDIHGAYDAFETIIRKAGVVDEQLAWVGGSDHLVVVGDVLDRGPDSRRALDLIMRLQNEATAAGGRVDMVLGNHEIMNMVGDLRYVSDAEYAAFAEDETVEMRSAAIERIPLSDEEDPEAARAELDAGIPQGFFAHREAFSPDGRYGSWLLEQPFLVAINDWAFVHGGLAEASRGLGADELNRTLAEQVHDYSIALGALIDAGILSPTDDFYEQPSLLSAYEDRLEANGEAWPEGMDVAANIVRDLNAAFVFNPDSPIWYRGNIGCSSLIEADRLTQTLRTKGVEHLIVGHTPSRDAMVRKRFEDRLYRIDTGMLNAYYGGRASALVVQGASVRALYEDSEVPAEVSVQPREVGRRPADMTQEQLAGFLETAEILSDSELDGRWRAVKLKAGDLELDALFTPAPSRNRNPDLAAYRLDLTLGLDMVPVTVARTIDGSDGALQYAPPGVITEEDRQQNRGGGSAWCPLTDQFDAMYVFDSLIGNTGRTLDRVRYSADNYQLLLVGHDISFPTSGEKPEHLRSLDLTLSPAWIERLLSLSESYLEENFGDILDRRQRRALLERRDVILGDAGISQ
jgi:hypothetical protein